MAQKWNLGDIRPTKPIRTQGDASVHGERASQSLSTNRSTHTDIAPRRNTTEYARPIMQQRPRDTDLDELDIIDGSRQKRIRILVTFLIASFIIGGAIFINILMGGAEVIVYPKFKDVNVQATFTGMKEPKTGDLGYELVSLEATGERQVKASGSEKVSERSEGTIFVYNTDSKSSQRLIKNTRFENPDGLIFKIKESIEVPKASMDTDGTVVPGVVTAQVFADGTGEQYNIAPSRFTVPGLKGSPQFTTIYGETTSALSGGFEGERYLLDEAELELRKQELHHELRASLLERLLSERPSGFVLYEDAVTFSFETLPATTYGDALATIKEKAILRVPIFKESELAAYLAKSTVAGYEEDDVHLQNPEGLTFTYVSATATISDISGYTEIPFNLNGTTRIVWSFDSEKLTKDLVGLSETAFKPMLQSHPAIDRAEAVIRPFWAQTFPKNPSEIRVETILNDAAAPQE